MKLMATILVKLVVRTVLHLILELSKFQKHLTVRNEITDQ